MAHQSSVQRASITSYQPGNTQTVDIRDPQDNNPSEIQPPGTDEDDFPQSLEEALLGE